MEESTENRFDYLRALSKDEQLSMMADLEEDLEFLRGILNDENASSEQKSETRNDIDYDMAKLNYLQKILETPTL